jgi:hypothetical protein
MIRRPLGRFPSPCAGLGDTEVKTPPVGEQARLDLG